MFNPDDNVTTSTYQTTYRGCLVGHVENIAYSDIVYYKAFSRNILAVLEIERLLGP